MHPDPLANNYIHTTYYNCFPLPSCIHPLPARNQNTKIDAHNKPKKESLLFSFAKARSLFFQKKRPISSTVSSRCQKQKDAFTKDSWHTCSSKRRRANHLIIIRRRCFIAAAVASAPAAPTPSRLHIHTVKATRGHKHTKKTK